MLPPARAEEEEQPFPLPLPLSHAPGQAHRPICSQGSPQGELPFGDGFMRVTGCISWSQMPVLQSNTGWLTPGNVSIRVAPDLLGLCLAYDSTKPRQHRSHHFHGLV